MAQVKIFGIKENLNPIKQQLSDVIHECVVEALKYSTIQASAPIFSTRQGKHDLSQWQNRCLYHY